MRGPLTLEAAQALLRAELQPIAACERVGLRDALGRILAEDVGTSGADAGGNVAVAAAGQRVGPAALGLLAATGHAEVRVRQRLRVALFSLADGLRSPGEALGAGEAYDGNRYLLGGLLAHAGAQVVDLGVLAPTPLALRTALGTAGADVIIAAAGVGVRAPPALRAALDDSGAIECLDVRLRPCRPLPFGRLEGGAVFFGLSSNPLPLAVMFHTLVAPALERLAGAAPRAPLTLPARARESLQGVVGYRNFRRGRLEFDAQGVLTVGRAGAPNAGVQQLMRDADCFIVLPEAGGPFAPGTLVAVQPFAGLR